MSAEKEDRFKSEVGRHGVQAASYLLNSLLELEGWSGSLDWSVRFKNQGVITHPTVVRSFSVVKRLDFLPEDQKLDEGFDRPLGIGHEQTNSQPTLVARMLELLDPRKGHAILDVGAGSGWTTALLASAVGRGGRVVGTERIPELAISAQENLSKYNFPWAKIVHTETELGYPNEAPYNRILVSAHMVEDWIPILTDQLSSRGGIMVAPIVSPENHGGSGEYDQSIAVIRRYGPNFNIRHVMHDVAFVPLIYKNEPEQE